MRVRSTSYLEPALKVYPPYRHVDSVIYNSTLMPYTPVDMCDLKRGQQYINLKGGDAVRIRHVASE